MLSDHFKHSLKAIGVVIILLVASYLWLAHRIRAILPPTNTTLPQNVRERVVYNEKSHALTVTTPKSTIRQYAKNPDVTVMKDGSVRINRHLVGLEHDLFLGLGYSDSFRAFLGANLFHVGRFDLSASLAGSADSHKTFLRPYAGIGYNLYSNTSVNVGINPLTIYSVPDVAVFVSVQL